MGKEAIVVNAFAVSCEGVAQNVVAPLVDNPANPSITVYQDGSRNVGCPYLNSNGDCITALLAEHLRCVQLFPISDKKLEEQNGILNQSTLEDRLFSGRGKPITLNSELIRQRAQDRLLSQQTLAKAMHRSQAFISNVFTNRIPLSRNGSLEAAYKLAPILDLPYEEIVANPEDVELVRKYAERLKELQPESINPPS